MGDFPDVLITCAAVRLGYEVMVDVSLTSVRPRWLITKIAVLWFEFSNKLDVVGFGSISFYNTLCVLVEREFSLLSLTYVYAT